MSRTLSVTDDETGITVSMRVEEAEDGTARTTRLSFDAAEGFEVTSEHLRMLQYLGLQLPAALPATPASTPPRSTPVPAPREPERVPATRKQQATKPSKATKQTRKPETRKRYDGGTPSDAVLQMLFNQNRGSVRRMAESIGSSTSSINRWMNLARERGVVFGPEGAANHAEPVTAS